MLLGELQKIYQQFDTDAAEAAAEAERMRNREFVAITPESFYGSLLVRHGPQEDEANEDVAMDSAIAGSSRGRP